MHVILLCQTGLNLVVIHCFPLLDFFDGDINWAHVRFGPFPLLLAMNG